MPIGSGLGASFGASDEVTVGTIVAPSRWYEFDSETLSLSKGTVQGAGLRGSGLYARAARRAFTTKTATGDVTMDVATTGMGLLYKHMLGTSTSALISGTSYQQVHTPGSLAGKSFTAQKIIPQTDGTSKPFTYNGCKVTAWSMSCEVGGILKLTLTLDAWNETTATAAGTPSYTAGSAVFHFAQGAVILGGTASTTSGVVSVSGGTTAVSITSATVTGSNAMKTDRFFLGSAGIKAEAIENGWREVGGTLDGEFVNQATIYDLFAADTATALQLRFTGTTAISGANFPTLEVIIPSIRFDGESPKVSGPEVVGLSAPFVGLDNGTDAAVQIRSVTSDTAI